MLSNSENSGPCSPGQRDYISSLTIPKNVSVFQNQFCHHDEILLMNNKADTL